MSTPATAARTVFHAVTAEGFQAGELAAADYRRAATPAQYDQLMLRSSRLIAEAFAILEATTAFDDNRDLFARAHVIVEAVTMTAHTVAHERIDSLRKAGQGDAGDLAPRPNVTPRAVAWCFGLIAIASAAVTWVMNTR